MSGYISIVILLYYMVMISYLLSLYGKYKLCPELLWCLFQLLMFFGITHFIDSSMKSDRLLINLYFLALIVFIISNLFSQKVMHPKVHLTIQSRPDLYQIRKPYVWLMIIVGVALCASFFARSGGNVFINGLRSLVTGADYSTKYSRMGLLSISGVGYIYQMRVIVLPLIILYYLLIKKITPISILLTILMIVFLIGTGQRGGLASFIVIALLTIYYWARRTKSAEDNGKTNKLLLYGGVLFAAGVLFALSTIMNGRVSEGGTVFTAILQRILEDNQSCAVYGFRYIQMEPIQYGRDWLMQMVDLLPGKNEYISLDTRIFAFMHGGSTAGTSPACIWGSAYYNFGIFGVILLSSILGWATTRIHQRFSSRTIDESGVVIYSALSFLLAYWVAAGPIVLFNNGFITTILLQFVLYIALKYRIVFGKSKKIYNSRNLNL